jgi:hypothetical protein
VRIITLLDRAAFSVLRVSRITFLFSEGTPSVRKRITFSENRYTNSEDLRYFEKISKSELAQTCQKWKDFRNDGTT